MSLVSLGFLSAASSLRPGLTWHSFREPCLFLLDHLGQYLLRTNYNNLFEVLFHFVLLENTCSVGKQNLRLERAFLPPCPGISGSWNLVGFMCHSIPHRKCHPLDPAGSSPVQSWRLSINVSRSISFGTTHIPRDPLVSLQLETADFSSLCGFFIRSLTHSVTHSLSDSLTHSLVLGIEPRASCMLDRHAATELHA